MGAERVIETFSKRERNVPSYGFNAGNVCSRCAGSEPTYLTREAGEVALSGKLIRGHLHPERLMGRPCSVMKSSNRTCSWSTFQAAGFAASRFSVRCIRSCRPF